MGNGAEHLFQSVQSKRLSDSAVEQILSLINSGQILPGSRLPSERDLMARLGLGRASVREAIRVLETVGAVKVVRGQGTWVREKPTSPGEGWLSWLPRHRREVMFLLEMRETLEVKAAALAAARGTDEDLAEIVQTLEIMKQAAGSGDVEGMVKADTLLHDRVAEASGNPILADALAGLSELVMQTRHALMAIPGRWTRVVEEHESIVDAVLARDPRQASRAMFRHVRRAAEEAASAAWMGLDEADPADEEERRFWEGSPEGWAKRTESKDEEGR